MNPDYGFLPADSFIGGFLEARYDVALLIRNDMLDVAFAFLVLHCVGSLVLGARRGETLGEIVVGRLMLIVVMYEMLVSDYFSFFAPLALMVGSLGPEISGFSALNPAEIALQGIDVALRIFHLSTFLSLAPGPLGALAIGPMLVIIAFYFWLAYKVTVAIVESMVLYMMGPFMFAMGMSAYTYGGIHTFVRMSLELGIRLILYHATLKLGQVGVLNVMIWVGQQGFFNFKAKFLASGFVIIFIAVAARLPEKYSEPFASGIMSEFRWGNPFAIPVKGS